MKTSRVDVFWYCFKIIKQYTIHCLMRSIPISGKQRYYQKQLVQKCSYKKVFWKYASNLQENTHFGMGVLQKICHIFQEHHFIRTTMEGCFCFLKYRNCLVHVSSKFSDIIFLVLLWLITSAVVITTAQPYSSKPEFRFYASSNPVRDVSDNSRWWRSVTDVSAGNKAKRLSSVNHSAKQFIIIIINQMEFVL